LLLCYPHPASGGRGGKRSVAALNRPHDGPGGEAEEGIAVTAQRRHDEVVVRFFFADTEKSGKLKKKGKG
jgi:hypothetical protein